MMNSPSNQKSGDWQNAYTRDQAHRDSDNYSGGFILPLVLCFLFTLAYSWFWAANYYLSEAPNIFRGATSLLIALSALIIFPIMLSAAFHCAETFFEAFYRPPAEINSGEIIRYRLMGKSKLPDRLSLLSKFNFVLIKDGEIGKAGEWPAWAAQHLGGPLMLIVFDGYALYLERGNRFSRIVGPGSSFLEWYETIKYVVDLRPQIKTGMTDGWTKDGIKIKVTAQIECRIGDPGKTSPPNGLLYPFDPLAVKQAIERHALKWSSDRLKDPVETSWVDAAWGQATSIISGYIGSRMLDDLFMAERGNGQILSIEALKEIFIRLNRKTSNFGVFVTDFQIQKIEFPKEVLEHQKEHWKAERQSIATIREGDTKASQIRMHEKERTEALRNLILTIASKLDKNKDDQLIESLMLSLPGFLNEGLKDPVLRAYLANQKLDTLDQLKKISNPPPPE